MKKRERTSYAFLMEMMWVCAFFLICACIFVLAFARAEQMSRKAETLNKATLAASNAMEEIYAAFDDAVSEAGFDAAAGGQTGFPAEADRIGAACSSDTYTLKITTSMEDSLLTVVIEATDTRDGEILCTLNGARAAAAALPDGAGASADAAAPVSPDGVRPVAAMCAAQSFRSLSAERRPL